MNLLPGLIIFVQTVLAVDLTYKPLPPSTSPGGRCMDGTMAGYYIRPGSDSDLFVIFVQGGGYCSDPDRCKERAESSKGSSKYFTSTKKGTRFLDPDCVSNPDFCDATHIHIPYCTSDGHRGTAEPSNEGFWYSKYYFDGHSNFKAIIDRLILEDGLKNSPDTKVLLFGNSAGGVGLYFNIDELQERIPAAVVKGAPMSGWLPIGSLNSDLTSMYPPSNFTMYTAGLKGNPMYDAIQAGVEPVDIYQMKSALPADCVDDYGDMWRSCAIMNQAYRYIKSPLYHVHTLFDSMLVFGPAHGAAPKNPVTDSEIEAVKDYIKFFGRTTYRALKLVLDNATIVEKEYPDGIFAASCLDHGTPDGATINGGHYWSKIVGDWFFERGELTEYHRQVQMCDTDDGSTLPCNANAGCQFRDSSSLFDICKEALESHDCLKEKDKDECLECVKQNSKDVLNAGCSPKKKVRELIIDICETNDYDVDDDLSPTSSPSMSSSSSALVDICKEALESHDCFKKKNKNRCLRCVRQNSNAVLDAGCGPKDKVRELIIDMCENDLSPTSDDPDAKYVRKIVDEKKKYSTCGKLIQKKKKKKKKHCCNDLYGDEGASVICPITCSICK